jgi:hypothetical protein
LRAVVASAHILRFRSFRDAGRGLFVDRTRLAGVDGLRFVRYVFVGGLRREGFTIGFVDPRRQMALCLWEDEAALDRFLAASPIGRRWRSATDQYCEVRMAPFRAHGSYRGLAPLAGLESSAPPKGATALWTFANIPPRGLRFFWSQIRHATAALLASPGLIAGTAGPEHLYRGAMTFTLWERPEDALGFAYRRDPHRRIVKDVRAGGLLVDSMFIRLQPYAASGSWPPGSRFGQNFARFRDGLGTV